jgi:hypothetical protein
MPKTKAKKPQTKARPPKPPPHVTHFQMRIYCELDSALDRLRWVLNPNTPAIDPTTAIREAEEVLADLQKYVMKYPVREAHILADPDSVHLALDVVLGQSLRALNTILAVATDNRYQVKHARRQLDGSVREERGS